MTPTPIDGPSAQRLAEQELARPEYHRGGESFLQRALDAIGRFLGRLLGGGGGSTTALIVVGVLILAVVLFAVVRAGKLPGRRRRTAPSADPLTPEAGVDHAARAAALQAQGALAEAMREYLRDAVATLERRGVLDHTPGRTGASTAREAGLLLPDARGDLQAAAAAFDPVWFGGRPATATDVDLARRAAAAVRTAPVGAR